MDVHFCGLVMESIIILSLTSSPVTRLAMSKNADLMHMIVAQNPHKFFIEPSFVSSVLIRSQMNFLLFRSFVPHFTQIVSTFARMSLVWVVW